MKKFQLVLLFIVVAISNTSKADVGCYANATTIYTTPDGTVNAGGAFGIVANYKGPISSNLPGSCPRFTGIPIQTGFCTYLGSAANLGLLVNFMPVACSLDDYAWPLALVFGLLGIFHVHKRKLYHC